MVGEVDILNAAILIVDDLEANVRLLDRALRGAGYTSVASTGNPYEVCELHRKNRYNLILLDLQMPGMDGFQVMEGLKEIEAGGYLPVLVITAQPAMKVRALKAGAKDFVSKPLDLLEVLTRVSNMIEVHLLHTETKKHAQLLEQSLRDAVESRARLEGLINSAQDAIISVDSTRRIVLFNPAAQRMFKQERANALGRSMDTLFPERYRQRLRDYVDNGVNSTSIDALSAVSGLRVGGDEFPLEGSISKVEIEGSLTSTLILRDITETIRAQKEIRALNAELELRVGRRTAELEGANRELEAFSYSVSHDLRSPLRGIDGWSQALLEDNYEQLDQTGRQYLDRVRAETQRMGCLIDAMLELARVMRTELQPETIDFTALAQDVARHLGDIHSLHPIEVSIAPGLVAVGDPRLLEIVLNNLIGNAFKFSGKRHDPRVEVGQTQLDGEKVFFVRDNGAGFDMAYASKMFGAFQRMHKVSEYPGTGVGLATVQRIVNRHGGKVWAESVVQQGATFSFTLQEYT